MKKQLWAMIVLASVAALSACSSSDSNGTGGTNGGSTPAPYVPKQNGQRIGEAEACKTIVDAMGAAAKKLQCVLTQSTCPGYLQSSQTPECTQWDEGSVLGCAEFYDTFTSCDDFKNRPCQVGYYPNSAPNGCPAVDDAGSDSQPDAETDAGNDSQADAGNDSAEDAAQVDAGSEAAVDAAEDTTQAVDAAAE